LFSTRIFGERREAERKSPDVVPWEIRLMEMLWLLAVFLVAIVFLPPDSVISPFRIVKVTILRMLVGGISVVWLIYLCRLSIASPGHELRSLPFRVLCQIRSSHGKYVYLALGFYGSSIILATVSSWMVFVSLWGKIPGDEGYSLYSLATYFVLFLAIAAHVRRPIQVWRLVTTVALLGTLVGAYGILQFAGLDPVDWGTMDDVGDSPVVSTLGNPIFMGSVLMMTIPVTAILTLVCFRHRWSFGSILGLVQVVIQLLAILLIQQRGPLVGLLVSCIVLLVLLPHAGNITYRVGSRNGIILGAVLVVAVLVIGVGLVRFEMGHTLGDRVTTTYEQVRNVGTSSGEPRFLLWQGSLGLLIDPPSLPFRQDFLSPIRPLVGYGPDLFEYVFPLGSPPSLPVTLSGHYTYAHNHLVHQALELGIIGVLGFLALITALAMAGMKYLSVPKSPPSIDYRLLMVGLLAVLAGRFVEQMFGIARVADQTIFWGLIALILVLPITGSEHSFMNDSNYRTGAHRLSVDTIRTRGLTDIITATKLVTVGCLAAIILWFTWGNSIDYIRASSLAASSVALGNSGQGDHSLQKINAAIGLSSDVRMYHSQQGRIYWLASRNAVERDQKVSLAILAYESQLRALELQPLSYQANLALANTSLDLVGFGRTDYVTTAIELYDRFGSLRPDSYDAQMVLAAAMIRLDDIEGAMAYADLALALADPESHDAARAYLLRGIAGLRIEQFEESATDARKALEYGDFSVDERLAAEELLQAALGGGEGN
jgi:hypothetical protein